jgi:tetratricopeptide (TPR) repeat protein
MKKLLLFLLAPILAAAAFLIWQNLPEKRFAKHVSKARLYASENNLTAARLEYEKAYNTKGKFTPYISLEVLNLTNRTNLQEKNIQEALNNTRMYVQEHPESKDGKMLLSQLAFQAGELEIAFDALDALIEMDPWYFPARLLLTNVRTQQGRLDLAEEQLRYLYGKYPDSLRALLPLSDVLIKQGRVAESRNFLRQVLLNHPRNSQARLLMLDSYLRERNVDSAQRVLDDWKEADPDQAQTLQIRKARVYSMTDRLEEAKSALASFTERKDANLPALAELALLHVKSGQYDSAIAVYKTMGEISPATRIGTETLILYLHLKNQNPARALEVLKALQISDKRPALMIPMVAAYVAIGQENKAVQFIQQQQDSLRQSLTQFQTQLVPDKEFIGQWGLITYYGLNKQDYWAYSAIQDFHKRWPANPMAIALQVSQLSSSGNFAAAAKVLATMANPTVTHQAALMSLYAKSGQADKAMALADKLAKENPKLAGVHIVLADYWFRKDKPKAIAHYEKELALNPNNTVVLNNLAWEYGVVQNDMEKAGPYLEKLKTHKRLDPRIMDTIGWILAVNGKTQEGEKFIRNALDLVPDYPAFLYHLAFVLQKTGKKEEARKYLDSALSSKLPFEERKAAEKLLAQMG